MDNYKILRIVFVTEAVVHRCSSKWLKRPTNILKRHSNAGVSNEISKNFMNNFFTEHLWWMLLSPKQIKRNRDILRKYTLRTFLLKYNDTKKHIRKYTL